MIKKDARLRQQRNKTFLTVMLLPMVALLVMLIVQVFISLIYSFQPKKGGGLIMSTPSPEQDPIPSITPNTLPTDALPLPTQTGTVTSVPFPSGKIVFTCTRGGYNHICTIHPDGTSLIQLTSGAYNDYYATLTHDGNKVVFVSNRSGIFQIYMMNLDGSNQEMIPVDLEEVSAPDLSPDGSWIVFAGVQEGDNSIYLVRPDGSNLHLLFGSASEVDPTWSSDGNLISFASTYAGLVELFTIRPDGSNLQQVTQGIERIGGRNSWSPDGETLSFYAGPKDDRDVFVVEIATNQVTQLTAGGNNTGPCFSPDGNWIVFSSSRDGDHELYVMQTDGSDLHQLTFNNEDDWQPRWGP